jgi:AcrR family transcriptional regulator
VSKPVGTHAQILVVALKLFADKGYEATSMREIAEQLGISKPALYYHFDSKEDIVRGILGDMMSQFVDLVDWARDQDPSPELGSLVLDRWTDIVQAHGSTMFRFMLANQHVVRDLQGDKRGLLAHLNELCTIIVPADATAEDQLRIRLALMSVNMAGVLGLDIDAGDDEVLTAARRVAKGLLPRL